MQCAETANGIDGLPNSIFGRRRVYGPRGMSYPRGFHGSKQQYAELLLDTMRKKQKKKYEKAVKEQLVKVQSRNYFGDWYWTDESPLQVTVQPQPYTYTVRRVLLRGVHTIGRQAARVNHVWRELRTWVADEMLVLPNTTSTANDTCRVSCSNESHVR